MWHVSRWGVAAGAAAVLLAGCVNLEARYRTPPLAVPNRWPIPARTAGSSGAMQGLVTTQAVPSAPAPRAGALAVRDIGWRNFFRDPQLQQLIALALANNRDLRVAVLNVEAARAQFDIQRAPRFPSLQATASHTRERASSAQTFGFPAGLQSYYTAGVNVTDFELDLFGRVRSLSDVALQQYFEQSDARRNVQLSLIGQIAEAYLRLGADRELERLAENTLTSQQASYRLTRAEHALGQVSGLDLAQALTTVESARADVALYQGDVAQDIDALRLLVGAPFDAALLPRRVDTEVTGLAPLPAGLPSEVLQRRPDVLEAEHALRAADANIGAARAAFFPTISLTGTLGSASKALAGLFQAGTGTWSFLPQASLPIFDGGKLYGSLKAAHVQQQIAVAQYEKAVQTAFREVADGLALYTTLHREREADQSLVQATQHAFALSQDLYKQGNESYLDLLVAERNNYTAEQGLISVELAQQDNLVSLFQALGGGWRERSP